MPQLSATARVTGPVLLVEHRSGVSRPRAGEQSGSPYSMTTARVLVEDTGLAEVRIPDDMRPPIKGQDVDYLVEFGVYAGNLTARALAEYAAA